ncbi:unnamed protein product [Orchesella dallaii]|uniref:Uncharacterized protein n=1 Tax=Orchesella dallaii TaxID=48710 RepID=A0ABP1RIJ4_9HEXA
MFPPEYSGKHRALQQWFELFNRPITTPTVIILINNSAKKARGNAEPERNFVVPAFSSTLLIFVDLEENSVAIGCFICHDHLIQYLIRIPAPIKEYPAYSITLEKLTKYFTISVKNLFGFWKKLHLKFHLAERFNKEKQCFTFSNYKAEHLSFEDCEINKVFFRFVNCTYVRHCKEFHGVLQQILNTREDGTGTEYSMVFPFGKRDLEFSFQVLFPKQAFFETNLTAFSTPFNNMVWLFTILAVSAMMCFLWKTFCRNFCHAIFCQVSILLGQSCFEGALNRSKLCVKVLMIMWLLCADSLRNFYNSSLYSFMAAERVPNDFPRNMNQLLDRKDYDFLLTKYFSYELYFLLQTKIPLQLENFYRKIFKKASFMKIDYRIDQIQTLRNATDGNNTEIQYFPPNHDRNCIAPNNFCLKEGNKRFSKFAVLCRVNCERYWNVAFLGQKKMHRINLNTMLFFRSFEFWFREVNAFASLRFSKFIGAFVESGLYDLSLGRYGMLNHVKLLHNLNHGRRLEMSNGSLFSYVLFKGDERKEVEGEKSTKVSAFSGTFVITGGILALAIPVINENLLNKTQRSKMADLTTTGTWSELQTPLIKHFRHSTVEFIWEDNNPLTTNIFFKCILLQCIVLNFDAVQLEHVVSLEEDWILARSYDHILKTNARLLTAQRYSSYDHCLISDSMFPPQKKERHRALQLSYYASNKLIPTVILVTINRLIYQNLQPPELVVPAFSSTILIFVNLEENLVAVGCFICHDRLHLQNRIRKPNRKWLNTVYPITLEKLTRQSTISFRNLTGFWKKLHSKFQLGSAFDMKNWLETCRTFKNYKEIKVRHSGICEMQQTFFSLVNCSDIFSCVNFHSVRLAPLTAIKHYSALFPFGSSDVEYKFQVLFPKKDFFDSNFTAFCTPFSVTVWSFTISAIFAMLLFVRKSFKRNLFHTVFCQLSILLGQNCDEGQLNRSRLRVKALMLLWILCVDSLHNFYNSSLYSFMAAERMPNDFPRNMNVVLDTKDYELILPPRLRMELSLLVRRKLPGPIAKFYLRILQKASYMRTMVLDHQIKTLWNASIGIPTQIKYFPPTCDEHLITPAECISDKLIDGLKMFTKFAVACRLDCDKDWNLAFLGQNKMHRITLNTMSFFRSSQFWFRGSYGFANLRFPSFLAVYVQSGIYEIEVSRFKLLGHIKILHNLNVGRKLGMSNGSLFSYVWLGGKGKKEESEEKSTKVTAFSGTFIVTGCMLALALVGFIFELGQCRKKTDILAAVSVE